MEQLAFTVAEACALAKIGRTALYEAIGDGSLVARKRGRKTLILASDLQVWVARLPTIQPKQVEKVTIAKAECLRYCGNGVPGA